MNVLQRLFGKKEKKPAPQKAPAEDKAPQPVYPGMRVEVTDREGRLLFVAKLQGLRGDKAELSQYSETDLSPEEGEAVPVCIRGYNDRNRKAVYMEAMITPASVHTWAVSELAVVRTGNDRAFFRLNTDLPATAVMFSGLEMGEKPCRMLNISVGGACIRSEARYHQGDKFLLKVKLIEDKPESVMYCQVLRVLEKENTATEYGCQFLELTEDDQENIIQNIFTAQRQKRNS